MDSSWTSGSAMIRLIAMSSWSINGCLLMATTYPGAQTFDRPKLKLLDCALRSLKFLRNVSNAFLLDETFDHDGTLIRRKTVDELKQRGAALDVVPVRLIEIIFGNRLGP